VITDEAAKSGRKSRRELFLDETEQIVPRSELLAIVEPHYAKAGKGFLGQALNGLQDRHKPKAINTDKAPTYGIAISELKLKAHVPGYGASTG